MMNMDDKLGRDEALDAVWAEYRSAFPDPEPTANFMPNLWQKIEARRVDPISVFRQFAKFCLVGTAALVLIFAISISRLKVEPIASNYIDALDAEHSADYVEVADAL
jgi:hypothetical protein